MTIGGLSSLFSRALDGLNVSSRGMSTVANNIANVNTPGYARQELLQATRGVFGNGVLGGGVTAFGVRSLVDPFIERQLANEKSHLGSFAGRKSSLSQLENILSNQDGAGVGTVINSFFNSWSELSNDPSSGVLRQSLLERGVDIVSHFHNKHAQVQDLRRGLSDSIEAQVDKVNSLSQEIARINDLVRRAADESAKLELKAQRNVVLSQLSEEIGVNYFNNSDETITVQINGTGMALVTGIKSSTLSATNDLSDNGQLSLFVQLPGGTSTVNVTDFVSSGSLGGKLKDRNGVLNESLQKLNELAFEFSQQLNAIHRNGYGLDGDDDRNFFSPLAGVSGAAKNIQIDNQILNNLNAIAAAGSDPNVTGVADNENALAILSLQNSLTMSGGSVSFAGFFSNHVSSVGISAAQVNRAFESQLNLVNRLEIQRENISGVNMDEEAADLIRYQRAFEGAAKVMSIANQVLDRLMEL
ncbi:MAG: flagellar hook-associated protein FlgK [Bradymonadales bacterium]|nr:MAG: flagellar hook-associated protein FlgK [Bradymonadales bacterium]